MTTPNDTAVMVLRDALKRYVLAIANEVHCGFSHESRDAEKELDAAFAALANLPQAEPSPTMVDAIAAGDGTLHGAIDYWQERALKAEAQAKSEPAASDWDAHEKIDALRRALEVIAVGDSKNPVIDAGDELVALGYWDAQAVASMRAAIAATQGVETKA